MVDYSKWSNVGDSDDEDDGRKAADSTPAADFGRQLLAQWVMEAAPNVSKDEIHHLTRFVEAQQPRLGERDNRSRATDITHFLETQRPPRTAPIVAAVAASQTRNFDVLDAGERAPALRVRAALTSALNTLCASKENGGPRKLFELMRDSPTGDVATRYAKQAYAAAAVDAFCEARLRATARADAPQRGALPKLRAPNAAEKARGEAKKAEDAPAPAKSGDAPSAEPAEVLEKSKRRPWRRWEIVGIIVALINVMLILLGLLVTGVVRLTMLTRNMSAHSGSEAEAASILMAKEDL